MFWSDPEQFLEENAVDCARYHARLTPGACAQYQRRDPINCKGCPLAGVDQVSILAFGPQGAAERMADLTRIGDCAECGTKRTSIVGRGLCSSCYRKARKAEEEQDRASEKAEFIHDQDVRDRADAVGVTFETEEIDEVVVDADENPAVDAVDLPSPSFPAVLDTVLGELREFLINKNRAYGNSALEPLRVFSKADPVEQLRVRIDDKLSRLFRGEAAGEDSERDLLGYLTLLEVARRWPCTSAVNSVRSKDAAQVKVSGASLS